MLLMSKVQVFIEADEDRDNVYLMDIILPEVLITPLKRQITHHNGTIIKNCNSIERIGTMETIYQYKLSGRVMQVMLYDRIEPENDERHLCNWKMPEKTSI
jgi:hypothetical protein